MAKAVARSKHTLTIRTSRFGWLKTDEKDLIRFPEGIIGFSQQKSFILVPHPGKETPFFWLQSFDEPTLAFLVVDPRLFCPTYQFQLSPDVVSSIFLKKGHQAMVWVFATLSQNQPNQICLNLQGPIVINQKNKLGKQLVLSDLSYPLRYKVDL